MRTEFLCISVLRVASGPKVKLASCKSALNPPVVYSTDRSKAVVPVLVLLFFCFVVYSTRLFVLCLTLCYFVLVFFSSFRIAVTSPGEEREPTLVLFVRLFDLRLFGFICFHFILCLGRAAVWNCGTPWTFLLPFLYISQRMTKSTIRLVQSAQSDQSLLIVYAFYSLRAIQRGVNNTFAILGGCTGRSEILLVTQVLL